MRLIIVLLFLTSCSAIYDKTNVNPKPIKENLFDDIYLPEDDEFIPFQKEVINEKPIRAIDKNFYKKVSINVHEGVDLKKILTQVATGLKINIRIANDIKNNVTFTAFKEPFIDVVKDLASMLGWHYEIDGNKLFIESDTPYFKTYDVHFLNISRETSSSISTNSNILTSKENAEQVQQDSETNGSASIVSTNSIDNFWSELEGNLQALIGQDGNMTIHKQAGIIAINANHKIHKKVSWYLEKLRQSCSTQVVVEAKILEVALNKEFRSGINWASLREKFIMGVPMGDAVNKEATFNLVNGSKNLFTLGVNNKGLSVKSILHTIERFGSIRTLSNPRITIMNNQTGIIKVAKQEVYFNLRYDNRYQNTLTTGNNRESIYSNIKTVPVGLIFSVHPVADPESGEVILTLRPTLSRIAEYKEDPSVSFLDTNKMKTQDDYTPTHVSNRIPVIEIREMDSVLRVKSGEVVVLGGLMSESAERSRSGLPHVNKVPIIGDIASANSDENNVSEIVIFLRVKIIRNAQTSITKKDKSIYNKFMIDNRPLRFNNENKKNIKK